MFLNFLMVQKPYIPLYSLYGSITISKFKIQYSLINIQHLLFNIPSSITISKFVIQHSLFFMFLNFLMVQKPYIPLYSLYGSIIISKFKIQYSLINIQHSLFNIQNSIRISNFKKNLYFLIFLIWFKSIFMFLNFLMVQKPSMTYMV
ncbi:MAG: hypothetical protein RL542_887 [Bacteroidota bacterium]|jgi:hypothetical protein